MQTKHKSGVQGLKHQTMAMARFFSRWIHLKAMNKLLLPLFLFKQDFITNLGPCYFSMIWFIGWPKNIIYCDGIGQNLMVLITMYFFLGKLEPISNVTWCEMYSLQVLSDILVDRINYRVMTSVYYEIKGGWTMRQKIREQVSYFTLFFTKYLIILCLQVLNFSCNWR